MATPPGRPPRARSSGGRTLMLLGVLLALAAGTIVIYIVSQATSTGPQMITVVEAKEDIPANTVLSSSTSDKVHVLIGDAFTTVSVPADSAPTNAFTFVSADDLAAKLNNYVVVAQIYQGEILRQNDPRLVLAGTGAGPGSLAYINPAQFPAGSVVVSLDLSGAPAVVAGDYVDILVTECNLPNSKDPGACETQTTLQNVYVYTVRGNSVFVVLDHQKALELKYLTETGKFELAVRKPGDSAGANTSEVDPNYVVKAFGY